VENSAFHSRHEFNDAGVANILDQAIDLRIAQFPVSHLPATEAQAGLDLISFVEEADGLILLRLIVVFVEGDGEFDFLDDNDFLLLAGGAFALIFFVEEAAVILNAADGGNGIWRDFDQIESTFPGNLQRLERRKDAHLLPIFVNDADLSRADSFVNSNK